MRKGWIALLVVALTVAFALPAMADVALNGFIKIKPYMNTYGTGAGYLMPLADNQTKTTSAFVDERARLRFQVGDENVKGVAFFELDQLWGGGAYATGRNVGGGLETDTTNIETKDLFIWFKVPNTSVDVTAGVLNASDSYAGMLFGYADFAGVVATGKFEPVNWRFGYGKLWENAVAKADDIDLWLLEGKFNPTKDVKLGVNFYFLNDMSGGNKGGGFPPGALLTAATMPPEIPSGYRSLRVYIPGVDFAANVGPAALSGFGFYQFGTAKYPAGTADSKVKGFALDLRADANLGPGKGFLETVYVSGNSFDGAGDKDYKSIVTLNNYNLAGAFFARTDMFLLFPNLDDIQYVDAELAYDSSNGGAGLWFIGGGYTQKLMDKLTGKVGLGYLAAAKKSARYLGTSGGGTATDPYNFKNNSAMATEVNAVLTYNIAKGLDFGVTGAYAFLGSAYEPTGGGSKAHNPWETHGRLVYAF